jgi:hypothetical protein
VIVTDDDGSRMALTRAYVHTEKTIDWDDLVEGDFIKATGGERLAITRAGSKDVIFLVPIGVLAPVAASSDEIDTWLATKLTEWYVGSTAVSVREAGGVTELRL